MSGRRVCEACGASYHVRTKPSKVEGVCDACGGKLGHSARTTSPRRSATDSRHTHAQTEPLIEFYRSRGKLAVVGERHDR